GLLLEQTFPSQRIQMVSAVISPQGAARKGGFARTDEYLFFVYFGDAAPKPAELSDDWLGNVRSTVKNKLHWSGLRRTGTNARRQDRPNLFYPIYLNAECTAIVDIGDAIPLDQDRTDVAIPERCVAVWPIRSDGSEGRWQISPTALRAAHAKGFVRV